jgi:hypothetical protein
MLFVNRSSWAHVLREAAGLLNLPPEALLRADELAALDGRLSPDGVII